VASNWMASYPAKRRRRGKQSQVRAALDMRMFNKRLDRLISTTNRAIAEAQESLRRMAPIVRRMGCPFRRVHTGEM
jgi:hypothetical protein